MGFLNKKKETPKESEDTKSTEVQSEENTSAAQPPKKKKKSKDMLASVLHESVTEAAVEIFAANEPFILEMDGETKYVGMFLNVEDIGGLSKKQSKDEAKGSIIECMNAGRISVYVTPQLLEDECLIIIPNAVSIDAMEEFGLLTEAPYKVCYVDTNGEVDVTDVSVTFETVSKVLLNNADLSTVTGIVDEPEEEMVPMDEDDSEFEDVPEDDYYEEPPVEDEPEYLPEEDDVPTESEFTDIDEDAPFGGNDIEMDDTYDSESYDNYDDTVDEEDAIEDEPEMEVSDEELDEVITRTFYSDELGLEVTTEPFDSQFLHGNPYLPFDENRGDGWLNGYLSQMSKDANLAMKRLHQDNLFQMRERYYTLISMHCEQITKDLDISNPDTQYGKLLIALQDKKVESLSDVDRVVSERKSEMNEEWEKKLAQVADDAARVAKQQYLDRYGRQHDADLYNLEPNIKEEIEFGYNEALRDLNNRRSMEAKKLLDYGINETLAEVSSMYMKTLEQEREEYLNYAQKMQDFLDENRKDEVSRNEVLREDLAQSEKADKVMAEKMQEIKALNEEFEAKKLQYEADIKHIREEAKNDIAASVRESEVKLADEKARNDKLQKQLDELMKSYEKLDGAKDLEYESRINALKQQNTAWQEKYDHIAEVNKRTSHIGVALAIIAVILGIACGFIGGSMVSVNKDTTASQKAIESQMNQQIDEYLNQLDRNSNTQSDSSSSNAQ